MQTMKMKFSVDKFWILVLFLTLAEMVAYCHGLERRPNYHLSSTENKDNNSVTHNVVEYFKKFWKQHNGGLCPFGQVLQRNNTVCCFVTSCGPGNEIEECHSNGAEDKCIKCKYNFLQLHTISSLNMEDAKCFPKAEDHEYCPAGDMRAARKLWHENNFPLLCECILEKCYIGNDVGTCTLVKKCEPGRQLIKTGICEPCPWYSSKNVAGCEPCTINETLLRQGKPGGIFISPELRTTTANIEDITSKENQAVSTCQENRSESYKKTDGLHTVMLYILLGVIFTLIVVVVIVAYRCIYYRRKLSSASAMAPPTPGTDNALLLPDKVNLTRTPNVYI